MKTFKSFLAPLTKDFIFYRKASNNWCNSYEVNLSLFDKHCYINYPSNTVLIQEMVDSWCNKRDTELNNSCNNRISVIISFIRYLKERGKTDVVEPNLLKSEGVTYIPHAFTEREFKNFFYACDTFCQNPKWKHQYNRKLTIPIFFRLLYSSGIRTTEARLLKVIDVDFEQGVLNINETKGHDQHFVVLDDGMIKLMKKYNQVIEEYYPNRTYFFTAQNDKHHNQDWVSKSFKEMWNKYNDSNVKVFPYDLRHHYAITNINSWIKEGFDFYDKLLYLSKSMGHRTLESTKYYYSLVPTMADLIEDKSGDDFDDIIPEVYNDEED